LKDELWQSKQGQDGVTMTTAELLRVISSPEWTSSFAAVVSCEL